MRRNLQRFQKMMEDAATELTGSTGNEEPGIVSHGVSVSSLEGRKPLIVLASVLPDTYRQLS